MEVALKPSVCVDDFLRVGACRTGVMIVVKRISRRLKGKMPTAMSLDEALPMMANESERGWVRLAIGADGEGFCFGDGPGVGWQEGHGYKGYGEDGLRGRNGYGCAGYGWGYVTGTSTIDGLNGFSNGSSDDPFYGGTPGLLCFTEGALSVPSGH